MKNFPFKKDGRTYWYSRAIVCVSGVFCKDAEFNVYVLANKRGTATANEVGKWNLPVGFLDFDETTAQCAAREIFEETGVKIEPKSLKLKNINSRPDGGNQDVGFRYYTTLPGTVSGYPLSTANMEKNEVVTAKWIRLDEVERYEWAWNHLELIRELAEHIFGKDVFKKPEELECISYPFRCTDGCKIDVFGTTSEWGHTDYWDCATYSENCKGSAKDNFIRSYKDIIERHPGIRPMKMDALLKEFIREAGK